MRKGIANHAGKLGAACLLMGLALCSPNDFRPLISPSVPSPVVTRPSKQKPTQQHGPSVTATGQQAVLNPSSIESAMWIDLAGFGQTLILGSEIAFEVLAPVGADLVAHYHTDPTIFLLVSLLALFLTWLGGKHSHPIHEETQLKDSDSPDNDVTAGYVIVRYVADPAPFASDEASAGDDGGGDGGG